MTILAIVNADKEGHIESKMMKSRQMEEIREARRVEADVRQAQRKSKLVRKPLLPWSHSHKLTSCTGRDKGFFAPRTQTKER